MLSSNPRALSSQLAIFNGSEVRMKVDNLYVAIRPHRPRQKRGSKRYIILAQKPKKKTVKKNSPLYIVRITEFS